MSENNHLNTRFLHITSEEFWAKGGGKHGKFRNWPKTWPKISLAHREGEFLARLWTLFGAPDDIGYEGFTYSLLDTETGIIFHAYSGGTGAAFGHASVEDEDFASVADTFETLIDQTTLTDCEIQFETDFGMYRAGARNGVAFEEETNNNMSTRCEIYFTFDLKPDTPPEILEALKCMIDQNYESTTDRAIEIVDDNDWKGILDISLITMQSFPGIAFSSLNRAYRYTQSPSQGGQDVYRNTLTFRAEVHGDAFGDDYVHLLTWMAQYSETQGFVGYFRYEGTTSNPTLLLFKNGALDTRDTFPQSTNK